MRRATLMSLLALAAAIALPASVLGQADVGIRREVRTGAQAGFDTGVVDAAGNVRPGSYLSVAVGIDISTYVENHEAIVTRERTLYASVQRYEVDEDGTTTWGPIWDGWTHDAAITLDPSFRSASGSGVLAMQECDYFGEPPTCIDRGTLEVTVAFTGTDRMAPEPQHFTIPASFGALFGRHGAAIMRSLSATGAVEGEYLGVSAWGNFYRVHEGETEVWPPSH
jgi:hypothetical protein